MIQNGNKKLWGTRKWSEARIKKNEMQIGLVVQEKKKKITLWNVSSHDTFWGSNTENQRAVKQSSASKWEVHNFRTRPFPYINDGRSTSFFLWHGTKKKPQQPLPPKKNPKQNQTTKKWDYLWLQLKSDGQVQALISLALLGPLTMILYGPVRVSWCDLWVLHFKSEPPALNSKPKKPD